MKNPWKQINIPSNDVSALRANADHPLDLFWAKDHLGRYLFIYEYPTDSEVLIKDPPDLAGIETISMSTGNSNTRLVLILKDKANWELFFALCNDLQIATLKINAVNTASALILHRLRRWQGFLKTVRLDILPEEQIKGLIGELLFLQNHLVPKFGYTDAVKFWSGPEGSPQDFYINKSAIEVKCQLGGTKPSIKISSVDQLYSQLPELFLFVVTLGKSTDNDTDSVNLPGLIANITLALEHESSTSLIRFQDLLMEAGFYFSEKYLDYNYLLLNEQAYYVCEDFPRINPEELKSGIIRLTYNISLSECTPFEIEINNWDLGND
ncbi:PD-(D/E)XK motif protein [Patescibacteria group bacterium]|nr:PD-(D/E)XK motif protein [Patescibacteria group bacterium]